MARRRDIASAKGAVAHSLMGTATLSEGDSTSGWIALLGGGSDGSWRGALGIAQRQIPVRMAGEGELGSRPPSKLRVWSSVVVAGPPLSWSAPCVDENLILH